MRITVFLVAVLVAIVLKAEVVVACLAALGYGYLLGRNTCDR